MVLLVITLLRTNNHLAEMVTCHNCVACQTERSAANPSERCTKKSPLHKHGYVHLCFLFMLCFVVLICVCGLVGTIFQKNSLWSDPLRSRALFLAGLVDSPRIILKNRFGLCCAISVLVNCLVVHCLPTHS